MAKKMLWGDVFSTAASEGCWEKEKGLFKAHWEFKEGGKIDSLLTISWQPIANGAANVARLWGIPAGWLLQQRNRTWSPAGFAGTGQS